MGSKLGDTLSNKFYVAMASKVRILISALLILSTVAMIIEAAAIFTNDVTASLNRNSFPEGFIFGTASAAYQYEGAANVDGRGPSIWDTFTHSYPDKIQDRSNGDKAIDEYHRYKEDVEIMKDMNMDAYRFSISWSRILPEGKLSRGVNKEGINYYNNLIDELLAKGIQPFLTIFHWDLPQALEDEYGGFLSPNIVNDFRDYAELCFKEFGDKVKHWITLNEPWSFSRDGYVIGRFAPGHCSAWQNLNCTGGDSATEPYIVSHHQLLAHSAAVNIYRTKYQASQKGLIGITLLSNWVVPLTDTEADHHAAERALDFMLGWYMEPLTKGDYPNSMRSLVGSRLPKFSTDQMRLLRGSFDFIGINYYTSFYAADAPQLKEARPSYLTDPLVNLLSERNGTAIGPRAASDWLCVYPKGLRQLLLYIKSKYNNPLIYITENGVDELDDSTLSLEEALIDTFRIDYYYHHLYFLQIAIMDGVNVKGYFAWSLMDNFNWASGYTLRFGLYFVDYKNSLKRHPKHSARWFRNFLRHQRIALNRSR